MQNKALNKKFRKLWPSVEFANLDEVLSQDFVLVPFPMPNRAFVADTDVVSNIGLRETFQFSQRAQPPTGCR